jgi:hypothetical protein
VKLEPWFSFVEEAFARFRGLFAGAFHRKNSYVR